MDRRIGSFEEFWPNYVGEHRTRACRVFHYLGKVAVLTCLYESPDAKQRVGASR